MFNKKTISYFVLIMIITTSVLAGDWYEGELHVYTGFRGSEGYDGNIFTPADGCSIGYADGYDIEELKTRAKARGIEWQGYADENFCLEESEFNTVKTDCENAEDSSFTCIPGETVVVSDNSAGGSLSLEEKYCNYCLAGSPFPDGICEGAGGSPQSEFDTRAGRVGALYENDTELIVSQETSEGDQWKVCAIPNGGYNDGSE